MLEFESELLSENFPSLSAEDFARLGSLDSLDSLELTYKQSLANEDQAISCFRLGAACLCCFVQDNFCGPPEDRAFLPGCLIDANASSTILKVHLALDGEGAYQGCRNPFLLLVAKWTFLDSGNRFARTFVTSRFWAIRTVRIWQHLFRQRQHQLTILFSLRFVSSSDILYCLKAFPEKVTALLLVELAEICCHYYRFEDASILLTKCLDMLHFTPQITGILGRRTKFQTFDCAQLVLAIERNGEAQSSTVQREQQSDSVPAAVPLHDDTLLERPCLVAEDSSCEEAVSAVEQCALLALVVYANRSGPNSCLLKEELKLYLEKIIQQRSSWSAQTAALYFRCQIEKKERRKVERAMKQLSESVDQFYDPSVDISLRFRHVFASCLPPIWTRESCLADILLTLGCSSEALKMFTRLKAWDSVIECYKRMGMHAKAEATIRTLLSEEESPELYCYLGEVTDDASYFVKAWHLSDERYARAQRCLGSLMLRKGQYEGSLEAFGKALKLQPLDLESLFSEGYCAMKLERYESAVQSYKRCVQIEPDFAEAWSNWAAAAMELGDFEVAYQVLQDALKCKYEDLKIWENFVTAALASRHFDDALNGINHILDHGGQFCQPQTVFCFVHSSMDGIWKSGLNSVDFRKTLKTLLGRLTSKYPNESKLWKAYAHVCEYDSDDSSTDHWEKYVSICERLLSLDLRNERWYLNESSLLDVLHWAVKLTDAKRRLAAALPSDSSRRRMLILSALSFGNEVLGKIEKMVGMDAMTDESKDLYATLRECTNVLKVQ